jgi:hypothetical protein
MIEVCVRLSLRMLGGGIRRQASSGGRPPCTDSGLVSGCLGVSGQQTLSEQA